MSDITVNDILDLGCRMAQALQDIIGETCLAENCEEEDCRTHAPDLGQLVDEWDELYATLVSRAIAHQQEQTP